MNWTEVSPGISTGEYDGWQCTRMLQKTDCYKVVYYLYLATKNNKTIKAVTWDRIKGQIAENKQLKLF
jgi:hypothetical protein